MTELPNRLRQWAYELDEQHGPEMWGMDMREAAERIEQLENGFHEILSLGAWGASELARTVAREALEKKDD
jgi:hypothetical protein